MLLALACGSCTKRYRVEGIVLGTTPARSEILVSHGEVPGYMPAMVMPFRLRHAADLAKIAPGDRIRARLSVKATGSAIDRIEHQGRAEGIDDFKLAPIENRLRPGAPLPAFELVDHQGRAVRRDDLAGRLTAINFIYTRCPLPEVCPRLSAAFSAIQRRYSDEMGRRLLLLSVTLDPAFDTSGVLARYAQSVGARGDGWRFLTGGDSSITEFARRFGLIHWAEEGMIVHTSVTALVGPDQRIRAIVEGSSFGLRQWTDLVDHFLQEVPR